MNFLLLMIVLVIIGAIVVAKGKKADGDTPWPFYAKKPLTNPEQILYFRLCKALPDHIVLAQVGLSRILGVEKGNNFGVWFNRINRMSADFVLCSKDATIVAVIELDDASHYKAGRQDTDNKKDKALSSAGIHVVRWQVKSLPAEAAIKATFSQSHHMNPVDLSRADPPIIAVR